MSIELSRETEDRLIGEARRRGISVETLLQRLMNEREAATQAAGNCPAIELPVWHLGGAGALRRRDIYDDVG